MIDGAEEGQDSWRVRMNPLYISKEGEFLLAHDAIRAATLLREIFANDRTRVGFLVGAGCPFSIPKPRAPDEPKIETGAWEGLIPNIAGLTDRVRQSLTVDLPELHDKLTAYLSSQGFANANIEVILSKLRALINIVGDSTVHGLNGEELHNIEYYMCEKIAEAVRVSLPEGSNGYRSLSSWIKGLSRSHSVEIFTTNYDLLIESALEDDSITTFDGFSGSRQPFFDLSAIERDGLPSHWVKVWKLHGSVNWREVPDKRTVYRVNDLNHSGKSLIHPSHLKYDQSRRLPYLALIDRLKWFIRQPSAVLIISGYSFGDEHINEVIVEGLENNPTAVAIATVYGKLASYPELEKLACHSSNLTAFAEDRAIVGKRKDCWGFDPEQGAGALRMAFGAPPEADWDAGNIRFLLGDFAALGAFLEDVSGTFKQVERALKS